MLYRNGIDKWDFNPRPPWGGRPVRCRNCGRRRAISIHALRGEGDRRMIAAHIISKNFNPRPPWGGRLSDFP